MRYPNKNFWELLKSVRILFTKKINLKWYILLSYYQLPFYRSPLLFNVFLQMCRKTIEHVHSMLYLLQNRTRTFFSRYYKKILWKFMYILRWSNIYYQSKNTTHITKAKTLKVILKICNSLKTSMFELCKYIFQRCNELLGSWYKSQNF